MEKRKAKLISKIKKYSYKENHQKVNYYKKQFSQNIYADKENELNTRLLELNQNTKNAVDKFNLLNLKIVENIELKLGQLSKEINFENIKDFINTYWNIVYNIEIFYEYEVIKPILINKNTIKRIEKGEINNELQVTK